MEKANGMAAHGKHCSAACSGLIPAAVHHHRAAGEKPGLLRRRTQGVPRWLHYPPSFSWRCGNLSANFPVSLSLLLEPTGVSLCNLWHACSLVIILPFSDLALLRLGGAKGRWLKCCEQACQRLLHGQVHFKPEMDLWHAGHHTALLGVCGLKQGCTPNLL